MVPEACSSDGQMRALQNDGCIGSGVSNVQRRARYPLPPRPRNRAIVAPADPGFAGCAGVR